MESRPLNDTDINNNMIVNNVFYVYTRPDMQFFVRVEMEKKNIDINIYLERISPFGCNW